MVLFSQGGRSYLLLGESGTIKTKTINIFLSNLKKISEQQKYLIFHQQLLLSFFNILLKVSLNE
jgi:hypothetical protein